MKNFIEHPNHIHILQSGVFKDVKSLDDLENNITRIFTGEDSNINKGNVFEIITEAELKSNPLHQAKNVWIKQKYYFFFNAWCSKGRMD